MYQLEGTYFMVPFNAQCIIYTKLPSIHQANYFDKNFDKIYILIL